MRDGVRSRPLRTMTESGAHNIGPPRLPLLQNSLLPPSKAGLGAPPWRSRLCRVQLGGPLQRQLHHQVRCGARHGPGVCGARALDPVARHVPVGALQAGGRSGVGILHLWQPSCSRATRSCCAPCKRAQHQACLPAGTVSRRLRCLIHKARRRGHQGAARPHLDARKRDLARHVRHAGNARPRVGRVVLLPRPRTRGEQ